MRTIIDDPSTSGRRPFVVTSDEGADSIILEAHGHAIRIGADEACRLADAIAQAATVVERTPSAAVDPDDESIGDAREAVGGCYAPALPRAPGSVL